MLSMTYSVKTMKTMKTDRLGLIRTNYTIPPISFTKIGQEILTDNPTFQTVTQAHKNLTNSLKVVGFGLFGLFAVRQFIK